MDQNTTSEPSNIEEFLDLESFCQNQVKGPWKQRKPAEVIYLSADSRLVVSHERADSFEALWRAEELSKANIYDAEVDVQQFVDKFMATIGQAMNIYECEALAKRLQKEVDEFRQKCASKI